MIDPKLNELPVDPKARSAAKTTSASTTSEAQEADRAARARAGLSIRDTVAGDTLLSTGSRGVDVSGVEAGAGAGSGSTAVTPGVSGSPAPNIVPGARATGTTPRGSSASGRAPATNAPGSADAPGITGDSLSSAYGEDTHASFTDDEIAARAYECWCERGQPHGSPEVDWHRAIDDLRTQRRNQGSSTNATTKTSAASV
jgi:hypothetical protein